ncbi:MAG: hypothetical protein ABI457_01190, partial [Hyphomicrobium sp.]
MAHHDDQRPAIGRWRSALATTVASTALFAYSGRPVRAQTVPPAAPCNQVSGGGTTVTCTGDVSTGVLLNNGGGPFTTLNIVNLTDDITPASGVDGIRFTSLGGITINSDTGPFAIISTARGIYANSSSGQPVTIRSNGDIVSVGDGIDGRSGSGDVAIASTGDITTTGAIADGIYAYAYNGTIAIASTGDITTQGAGGYGIRSFGSLGATGIASFGNITTAGDYARGIGAYSLLADVAIASSGNITTGGFNAHGIYAHVVSGAGEVAITSTGNITTRGTGAVGILVDVDGSGDVAIASFGNIATFGDTSYGIKATANGDVAIDSLGTISTGGASSTGIFAASTTGSVSVSSSGNIATLGDDADGVAATSNGGPVTITSNADIATSGNSASGIFGGAQGDPLTIMSFGNIATEGNNSFGIAAGSITGSVTITSTGNIATEGTNSAAINVGTDDGAITINSYGNIATAGTNAIGINASSVYGAISIASYGDVAVAGAGSIGINAQTNGDVTITSFGNISAGPDSLDAISALSQTGKLVIVSRGDITTMGTGAYGIRAMGYASAYVFNAGNITTTGDVADALAAMSFGTVTIVNTGNISATGSGSAGIFAGGQAGNVVLNLGTIEGCPCAGVVLMSNGTNQLTNFGSIISVPTGLAIEAAGAANFIDNFGTITGDVEFVMGGGEFNNHAGALFNAGDTVEAGLVTNDGTLNPGGAGVVLSTALGDSFVQNAGGIFAVDVSGSTSDQIFVSNTANLAGKVAVTVTSLPTTAVQSYLILEALSGVTDNGLSLTASPALHATLTYPNATDVVLGVAVDFTVDGLNPNQRAIATNLSDVFNSGVGTLGPAMLGLLNVTDLDEFKAALNQLSPELYSDAEIAALYSSLAFSNSLLSCKVNGTDTASIIREGQCLWAG